MISEVKMVSSWLFLLELLIFSYKKYAYFLAKS